MRRKRVPERVRTDAEPRAAAGDVSGDQALHAATRQTAATHVDEQRVATRQSASVFQPGVQSRPSRLVERQEPLFSTLPHRPDNPLTEIDILEVETDEL